MLDKLMAAFKPKQPAESLSAPVLATPDVPEVVAQDPKVVSEMAVKLEAFVYDSEIAAELALVFVSMSVIEGFDKVLELLDAKEKQIEAISGNSPQQSTPDVKTPVVVKTPTASEILKARNQ